MYRRKGLLDEIPDVRLIRGVILVRTENAGTVVAFPESYDAEVYTRTVVLTKEDRDAVDA